MKFPKDTPVTEKKKNQLMARIERLGINLSEVTEGLRGCGLRSYNGRNARG